MTVFVAEINGRAIAAFNAENEIHAEGRAASKPFRADLTVLENEGRPLWNGTDEIFVRKALPAEEAQFNASQARAISEKEIDEDDDWLMFLVPVTDPIGDFDPYDAPRRLNGCFKAGSELEAAFAKEMAALGLTVSRPYARHSVKQPMACVPPPKIAWLLGFNEVSAFTHAFKRWTGKTPPRDANSGRLSSAMGCETRAR